MLRTLLPCPDINPPVLGTSAMSPPHRAGAAASAGRPTRSPPQHSLQPESPYRSSSVPSVRQPPPPRSRSADYLVAEDRSETSERDCESSASERTTHDASTASYRWPRFQPTLSGKGNAVPVLYVDYRSHPRSVPSVQSERIDVSGISPLSTPRSPAMSTPSSPSYTSLSSVTAGSSSSRDRNSYSPRSSHAVVAHATSEHVLPRYGRSTPSDSEIPTTLRRLDINAQSARVTIRRRATGSPTWHPYSSESESSCGKSPTPRAASAVQRSEAEPEQWTRYARAVETDGSSAMFICIWTETKEGHASPCGYQSKKHLVKRHIESKHLQIKPIICEVCGKGFSQRTNYSTHMNTHTGAAPHKCQYPGCEQTFGDPARRHRHMKAVHNHIPSKRRTQSDSGSMHLDIDMSEPEDEDST